MSAPPLLWLRELGNDLAADHVRPSAEKRYGNPTRNRDTFALGARLVKYADREGRGIHVSVATLAVDLGFATRDEDGEIVNRGKLLPVREMLRTLTEAGRLSTVEDRPGRTSRRELTIPPDPVPEEDRVEVQTDPVLEKDRDPVPVTDPHPVPHRDPDLPSLSRTPPDREEGGGGRRNGDPTARSARVEPPPDHSSKKTVAPTDRHRAWLSVLEASLPTKFAGLHTIDNPASHEGIWLEVDRFVESGRDPQELARLVRVDLPPGAKIRSAVGFLAKRLREIPTDVDLDELNPATTDEQLADRLAARIDEANAAEIFARFGTKPPSELSIAATVLRRVVAFSDRGGATARTILDELDAGVFDPDRSRRHAEIRRELAWPLHARNPDLIAALARRGIIVERLSGSEVLDRVDDLDELAAELEAQTSRPEEARSARLCKQTEPSSTVPDSSRGAHEHTEPDPGRSARPRPLL